MLSAAACQLQIETPTSWAVAYNESDAAVVVTVEGANSVLAPPQRQGHVFSEGRGASFAETDLCG
jgi:hypothetical protein